MKNRKLLSLISLVVLLAMTALLTVSCGGKNDVPNVTDTDAITTESPADTAADSESESVAEITVTVMVTDDKGETKEHVIKTTETMLRGALEQENLIEGDESEYGLYVKTVDGLTADYDTDGAYWAFYDGNDEYLMTGVDTTPISDGAVFKIVYTKG